MTSGIAAAWQALDEDHARLKTVGMTALFAQDAARFDRFSIQLTGMIADYSRHAVDDEAVTRLLALAAAAGVEEQRNAMFSGEKINTTEHRAVLHTALRAGKDATVILDGENIVPSVHDTLARMGALAGAVQHGTWRGHTGKEITDIVNIGIGGSSLGPQLAVEALTAFHHPRLRAHFIANVEASELDTTLTRIAPETTLFVIVSKTFTTAETMMNARIARAWLVERLGEDAVAKHMVAATVNTEAAAAFGIPAQNTFPFADWVGGRYSLWAAAGLSVMLMTGAAHFAQLLQGAREMDAHFKTAPLRGNMPVMLALLGIWHRNVCGRAAKAVIPYHAHLRRLPAYLQQLDMESNGKSVTRDGLPVTTATGPAIFGEPGTDAQHSFFQWLHQGTDVAPVDIIAAVNTPYGSAGQQKKLLSNALAQAEALAFGHDNQTEPHRHFTGNRPSTVILLDDLDPRRLGMLLALYEHIVFVQGVIWGINSFDQWGVELGKKLAAGIEPLLVRDNDGKSPESIPAPLDGLLRHIRQVRRQG